MFTKCKKEEVVINKRIIAIYIEKNGKERDWISVFDKGQGKVKKLSKTILNDAIHDIKRN